MRILHGPVNIGNQARVLSQYERELGANSRLVINYGTWLEYESDRVLSDYGDHSRKARARRLAFGLTAPIRHSVMHLYFGRSFLCWDDYGDPTPLWYADLRLAKRLRRTVFMTLHGCDVRISSASSAHNAITPCHLGACSAAPMCRARLDERRREMVRTILPLADRVFVLNPELVRYAPGSQFLPYASVDVHAIRPTPSSASDRVTIVHAPSDEGIKGTAQIVAAVNRLQERHPIDFRIVKGVPHAEALKLYRQADLVIDQLLAGWYGGLAVEVMAMGKPVACYMRGSDFDVLPDGMRSDLPLVRISPETLDADLEAAIARRDEWRAWGQASREFALQWHDPRKIAAGMLEAYCNPAAPVI